MTYSAANDVLHRRLRGVTEGVYGLVENDPLAEVKRDPAALFRAGGIEPDPAQIELLTCKDRNVLVLWTRQFAGKSQTAACIALYNAMTNLGRQGRGSTTVIFSAALRESTELLRKVRHLRYGLLHKHFSIGSRSWRPRTVAKDVNRYKEMVAGSDGEATGPAIPPEAAAVTDAQTVIELENGSRIISLPARSQATVGYTVDLLILDEAKIIPDDLYNSVRPMLAMTKGRMIALTTPLGQRGWFWEAWKKCEEAKLAGEPEPYRRFRRTCWECPRLDRDFITKERQLIGDHWFQQEYECAFLDPVGALFRGEDLSRAMDSKEEPYSVPW